MTDELGPGEAVELPRPRRSAGVRIPALPSNRDLLAVLGLVCLTAAFALVSVPLALAFVGLGLIFTAGAGRRRG